MIAIAQTFAAVPWDFVGLGAAIPACFTLVALSSARHWGRKAATYKRDAHDARSWAEAQRQIFERQITVDRRLIANLTERLERIAAQDTPHSNATVKRMVRIAKGEE